MTVPTLPPLRLGALDADVPAEFVPPDDRAAVAAVKANPTVVRPLVVKRVATPVATFERLLGDLPGTARLVHRLGKGRYRIEPCPDGTIAIDDGRGAHARVARLVAEPGVRLYRAIGALEVFPVPPLRATGIVTLRFQPEGEEAVWTGGQIYCRLESAFLHRLARPILRLLHATIDARVRGLVAAAVAACEHEAAAGEGIPSGERGAG